MIFVLFVIAGSVFAFVLANNHFNVSYAADITSIWVLLVIIIVIFALRLAKKNKG